jgi:hypothetical protein
MSVVTPAAEIIKRIEMFHPLEEHILKNVNSCWNTKFSFYLETSSDKNSCLSHLVHFLTPVLIRYLWELKIVVLLRRCLLCAVVMVVQPQWLNLLSKIWFLNFSHFVNKNLRTLNVCLFLYSSCGCWVICNFAIFCQVKVAKHGWNTELPPGPNVIKPFLSVIYEFL